MSGYFSQIHEALRAYAFGRHDQGPHPLGSGHGHHTATAQFENGAINRQQRRWFARGGHGKKVLAVGHVKVGTLGGQYETGNFGEAPPLHRLFLDNTPRRGHKKRVN